MADPHHSEAPHAEEAHHAPKNSIYWMVFGALAVFTVISFVVNSLQRNQVIGVEASFLIILLVAVCKAALVGAVFMHLFFDWRTTYFLIVPTMILAALLLIVLWPDMVLAWKSVNAAATAGNVSGGGH